MVHPTAIIYPGARLHPTVEVGAYAVIEDDVELGAGCTVGHHACIMSHTTAGERNVFGPSAIIGGAPQDLKYKGDPTRLRIGNGNVFREMVTLHRSNKMEEDTCIGNECFLMANAHVGHNAVVGDHVIIANGALIAGHCVIGKGAFISGNVAIHQFVRIGELAMVQGVSAMSCDVPPFTMVFDKNLMAGLNIVGLRRAGMSPEERLELKKLYKILFRSRLKREDAIYKAEMTCKMPASCKMIEFLKTAKRSVVSDLEMLRRTEWTKGDES